MTLSDYYLEKTSAIVVSPLVRNLIIGGVLGGTGAAISSKGNLGQRVGRALKGAAIGAGTGALAHYLHKNIISTEQM